MCIRDRALSAIKTFMFIKLRWILFTTRKLTKIPFGKYKTSQISSIIILNKSKLNIVLKIVIILTVSV